MVICVKTYGLGSFSSTTDSIADEYRIFNIKTGKMIGSRSF
jgi:hypothetical protein